MKAEWDRVANKYNELITEKPMSMHWKEGTTTYFRPISYYFDLLSNNNFVTTDLKEIVIKHDMGKSIKEKTLMELKKQFPSFMIIKCRKE